MGDGEIVKTNVGINEMSKQNLSLSMALSHHISNLVLFRMCVSDNLIVVIIPRAFDSNTKNIGHSN